MGSYIQTLGSRKTNYGWGFSSVVEPLPSKHKALGSVSSSEKKKKKEKKKERKKNKLLWKTRLAYLLKLRHGY